jgi:hypothetical protein
MPLKSLLHEIEVAACKGDVSDVLALSKKLEKLASLMKRRELSPRERGRRHRVDFVQALARMGVTLQPLKGAIFKSPRGVRVGVAYAREDSRQKDKWFLGLPENKFEHAVLLCEDRSGKEIYFSLPKEFLHEHGKTLSKSGGQIKFNVARRIGEFFLDLPWRESVTIEAFRDNLSGLI